ELLQVPGIGPAKRRLLLSHFGSVQGVREAGEEAIATLPGFSRATARRLLEALARSSPTAPADAAAPAPPESPA
ncbi:MAG TPA: helix-hairpin-helix domain-containing protein, partial [Gemmatimonadaceae bacterium]